MEAENYMLSQTTKFSKILVVGLYCIFSIAGTTFDLSFRLNNQKSFLLPC